MNHFYFKIRASCYQESRVNNNQLKCRHQGILCDTLGVQMIEFQSNIQVPCLICYRLVLLLLEGNQSHSRINLLLEKFMRIKCLPLIFSSIIKETIKQLKRATLHCNNISRHLKELACHFLYSKIFQSKQVSEDLMAS